MTAAQRVKHVRIEGPKKHGVPLCGKCGLRTLQSAKRRAIGLCLECAGGASLKPLRDAPGPIALRALLEKRGITIRALALELGIHENNLQKWARGNWSPQGYFRRLLAERCQIPEKAWPPQKRGGRRPDEARKPKQRLIEVSR